MAVEPWPGTPTRSFSKNSAWHVIILIINSWNLSWEHCFKLWVKIFLASAPSTCFEEFFYLFPQMSLNGHTLSTATATSLVDCTNQCVAATGCKVSSPYDKNILKHRFYFTGCRLRLWHEIVRFERQNRQGWPGIPEFLGQRLLCGEWLCFSRFRGSSTHIRGSIRTITRASFSVATWVFKGYYFINHYFWQVLFTLIECQISVVFSQN